MNIELDTKILQKGGLIVVTAGEYSDYGIVFATRALRDFNIEKAKRKFPYKGSFNEYSFGIWLIQEGYVEEVEVTEWALGNCGRKNELSKPLEIGE